VLDVQNDDQKNDLIYFENLDSNIQEVIIDLIVSIIENKLKKNKEN
jgi:hypothetical protein